MDLLHQDITRSIHLGITMFIAEKNILTDKVLQLGKMANITIKNTVVSLQDTRSLLIQVIILEATEIGKVTALIPSRSIRKNLKILMTCVGAAV